MKKTVTAIVIMIFSLFPLCAYASEYDLEGGLVHKESVEVWCDARDLSQDLPKPTASPTPTVFPKPTAPPEKEWKGSKEAPWWAKLIEELAKRKSTEKITEKVTERVTEKITEKVSGTSSAASPSSSGTYYPNSSVKENPSVKTPSSPVANLARNDYESRKSRTSVGNVTPAMTYVTGEPESTQDSLIDHKKMHDAWDAVRAKYIPNEYYKNGAKPIPSKPERVAGEDEAPEELIIEEKIEQDEFIGPVIEPEEAQIVEIKEEKIPFYKTKAFRYGIMFLLIALALWILLLIAHKTGLWYMLANKIHKKKRPQIMGVLTDEDNWFIDIIEPKKADEYRLLQNEVNKSVKNKESADELYERLKEGGFKTRLPYKTLMSVSVYEDSGNVSTEDMVPSDTAILDLLHENEGRKVKLRFLCEKAGLDETVVYELNMDKEGTLEKAV